MGYVDSQGLGILPPSLFVSTVFSGRSVVTCCLGSTCR